MSPTLRSAIVNFIAEKGWDRISDAHRLATDPNRIRALLIAHADARTEAAWYAAFSFVWGVIGIVAYSASYHLVFLILALMLVAANPVFWLRAHRLRSDGPAPTVEFLSLTLPTLDLALVQRRYAEALVAVYGEQASDPYTDGLGLLHALAEEETRLLALESTVASASLAEVRGEAETLRARLGTARDPAAREALTEGLAVAERRLRAAERAEGIRERLDAHRLLLDQASRAALERIVGRGELGTGLDDLRANVAALGCESAAIEDAVQEMRAL